MFVPVRLLEMGFSMRHIYKAMEAAGILQNWILFFTVIYGTLTKMPK
uniref:Uncharacterized protein n=1 Tax=Anguilla anguilla TaxID=7936 RepID=A0A0E9VNP8_ANGAN